MRRVVTAAVALLLLTAGVACSDDEGSANGPDATAPANTLDLDGDEIVADDPSFDPISDEEFDAQMGALRAEIEAADDDLCSLSAALGSLPPDPVNREQAKEYADTYVLMLRNIAKVLGTETDAGVTIDEAADQFAARAAELDYSPSFVEDDGLFSIMNNEDVALALVEFGQMAASCPDATG